MNHTRSATNTDYKSHAQIRAKYAKRPAPISYENTYAPLIVGAVLLTIPAAAGLRRRGWSRLATVFAVAAGLLAIPAAGLLALWLIYR